MASLAAAVGVTQTTLRAALRRQGVPDRGRPNSGRKPIPLAEADLRAWAAEGLSTREMAGRSQVSEETIRRAMILHGIDRLPAKPRTERNGFWRGGLIVDADGYFLVKRPEHPRQTKAGYVRLHRLVMERHLGRFLETIEVVDHLDGDMSDNRIHNLVLYPSNGEHLRATLTGRHAMADRLTPAQRESQRQADVQRANQRLASIRARSGNGAHLSLSELDLLIDELATGAPAL